MDVLGTRTLRDLLLERERRDGARLFLTHENRAGEVTNLTYAQFVDSVRRVATGLTKMGITRGDALVLHLPNCPELLQTMFALAWIGAVMVPSNTANTHGELLHVVQHSEAVGIVGAPEHHDLIDAVANESPRVRHRVFIRADEVGTGETPFAELLRSPAEPPVVVCAQEDLFELIFTSGTTARPKAVMLTHANALRSGDRGYRYLAVENGDRLLTSLPLFHVNAQSTTVFTALAVGASIVILEEYRASKFMAQVRAHQATVVSLVAMQARTLLAQPPGEADRQHRLRRVFYAINVSDAEKEELERRFGIELVNGYGMSEAMTVVTAAPVFGEKRWPSIGLPVHDRKIRVVDDQGADCTTGTPGEILVWGEPGRTLMKGYFKDPEATRAVLSDDGWFRTGDNGYFDEGGYLYFFDRAKDVIKRAGENISASEVEAAIVQHPDVEEAAVIGVPDPIRDEAVLAFVVLRPGAALTLEELRAHCRTRLASFKLPTVLETLAALPRTSIGKVEKKLLRQQARERGIHG